MAKVFVYNKKTKDERFMGEDQFNNWGKKNGFALVPEGAKMKNNDDSGDDSGDVSTSTVNEGGEGKDNVETKEVKKLTSVADIVTEIERISKDEELSDEEKIEKIKTFGTDETRTGITKAVVKFVKLITEKDA